MARCNHVRAEDWQAAATAIGNIPTASSFDEMGATLMPQLRRLFGAELIVWETYDNQRRQTRCESYPDVMKIIVPLLPIWPSYLAEHPSARLWPRIIEQGHISRLSEHLSLRALRETGLWNEIYVHLGSRYQLHFGGRHHGNSTWSIVLNRLISDFGPRERELALFLRPHICRHAANLKRHDRARRIATLLQAFAQTADTPHLLASAQGRVLKISAAARRFLGTHAPDHELSPGAPLPGQWQPVIATLARGLPGPSQLTPPRFETVTLGNLQALILRLLSDGTSFVVLQQLTSPPVTGPRLTRREAEILVLITEGKTNPAIGRLLGLSPRTVDKHCQNLFAKLGVSNRLGAALLGRHNILQ